MLGWIAKNIYSPLSRVSGESMAWSIRLVDLITLIYCSSNMAGWFIDHSVVAFVNPKVWRWEYDGEVVLWNILWAAIIIDSLIDLMLRFLCMVEFRTNQGVPVIVRRDIFCTASSFFQCCSEMRASHAWPA